MPTPIEVDAFRYARIENPSALSAPLGRLLLENAGHGTGSVDLI